MLCSDGVHLNAAQIRSASSRTPSLCALDRQNRLLPTTFSEHALETTRRHADRVKECIQRLGDTSALKTSIANIFGTLQGLSTGPAEDEEMARWLGQQLPTVVEEFLRSKARANI